MRQLAAPMAGILLTGLLSIWVAVRPLPARAYTSDEKTCVFAAMERLPKVTNMVVRAVTVAAYRKGDGGPGRPAGSTLSDPKTVTITIGIPDVADLDTTFAFICGTSVVGGITNTVAIPNGKPK